MAVTPSINNAPYQAAWGNGSSVPLLTTGGSPQPVLASHPNQLLMTHQDSLFYQGNNSLSINQTITGTVSTAGGTWVAQKVTATAAMNNAISYVTVFVSSGTPDGTLNPTSVQLYTDNAGAPGTPIPPMMALTNEYTFEVPSAAVIPIGIVTGLVTGTPYWVVFKGVSSASLSYTFSNSNSAGFIPASTSTNGTTWTAQSYGLWMKFWTTDTTGPLTWVRHEIDTVGLGTAWTTYYRTGTPGGYTSNVFEYVPAQLTNKYQQSTLLVSIQNCLQNRVS